jgi:kumamolisin
MSDPAASSRIALAGSERKIPSGAVLQGACDRAEIATVTLVLRPKKSPLPHAAKLAAIPPAERTYVAREEFAKEYGASEKDLEAVERFAADSNLTVVSSDLARRSVVLSGTIGALADAFGAELKSYSMNGATFRGREGALTMPASLGSIVTGVFGLDNRPQARAQFRRRKKTTAAAPLTALQVAGAYAFPAGEGAGQTIALLELGGGYTASDLDAYFSGLGLATPSVTSVSVDGATNSPTGNANSADAEVLLDIEVAGSIAPGAKIVVYFAPNTDQGFLDCVTTIVHDTANNPNILSISWGGPESTWTTQSFTNFDTAFADAATLGMTVMVAAGDNGSSDGVDDGLAHVDFPASSPHVLACGGTELILNGTAIASEVVWNGGTSDGATGGGISTAFPVPSWQSAANVPPSVNAGAQVGRGVPDVAGDADPRSGYDVYVDGASTVIGGTSAVAPLWGGLVARLNALVGKPLGFINPVLYANASAFNDVTSGNNGAYSAGPGWDACTGLGTPDGASLLAVFGAPATSQPSS